MATYEAVDDHKERSDESMKMVLRGNERLALLFVSLLPFLTLSIRPSCNLLHSLQKFGNVCGGDVRFLPTPSVRFPSSGPFAGKLDSFVVYDRPLLTSEAVSNARFLSRAEATRGSKL